MTDEQLDELLSQPAYRDDKNKVVLPKSVKDTIRSAMAWGNMCGKCENSTNGHIIVVFFTVNQSGGLYRKTVELPYGFCKEHEKCNCENCTGKAVYLFNCGHRLCLTHFNALSQLQQVWFCKKCEFAVCGLVGEERNHRICFAPKGNHLVCFKYGAERKKNCVAQFDNPKSWRCNFHVDMAMLQVNDEILQYGPIYCADKKVSFFDAPGVLLKYKLDDGTGISFVDG